MDARDFYPQPPLRQGSDGLFLPRVDFHATRYGLMTAEYA